MDFKKRWEKIDELGFAGGQGKVFRVIDISKLDHEIRPNIIRAIQGFTGVYTDKQLEKNFKSFRKALADLIRMEDPIRHGALKVLHEPKDARDSKRAEARLKKEIKAMSDIKHPNLLKILDYDPDAKWFVSEFHPKGALVENKNIYTGNLIRALKAFRPLVEGVSELHKNGIVHRDVKPQNVFISSNNNLILGDFGLVFFIDDQHTRISETWQNVGTHAWMPPWAFEMKIEDVQPTFDVFSLGKLLWAMVSQKPTLQLWYFEKPNFNLENMFPNIPSMQLANTLFKKCIVQFEEDCLPDATALLKEVDNVLSIIDMNADVIGDRVTRTCKVCGIGRYRLVVNQDVTQTRNFGLSPRGESSFKIFICNNCGNVQLFAFGGKKNPPAWNV